MVQKFHNIDDLAKAGLKRLPLPIRDYLVGGADDEVSLKENSHAFKKYQIIPNTLVDVADMDLTTTIMGEKSSLPIMISPTGGASLFGIAGDVGGAAAAQKCGVWFGQSTLSSDSIEDVSKASDGPKIFQLYIFSDFSLNTDMIERCKKAKFKALCLTVDSITGGNRERDVRSGFTVPPRLTPKSLFQLALKPGWVFQHLFGKPLAFGNFADVEAMQNPKGTAYAAYMAKLVDQRLNWDKAKQTIDLWDGPFALKGIMSVGDAIKAKEIGATTIYISNHGGRQLDGTPAPIDRVEAIRQAVGNDMEIIVDGGIRRGTDIFKALALGANAVSIGRPYLYGLAAAGEAGAVRAIEILKEELTRCMQLSGCRSLADINRDMIVTNTALSEKF